MTQKHLTDQRFSDFDLDPALQRGIEQAGFEFLTPIQAGVLPVLLQQQDVAGQAQTGTGKTAAFLIAAYTRLLQSTVAPDAAGPRALMLAPTRELAIQIHKDAEILGSHLQFRLALAYGGTGYETQRRHIQGGIDVLIGTPGRIIDYYKQGIFSLDNIEVMVLDEADRMFDLGFIRDIRYVFRRMPSPEKRLNMMFSATLSLRVAELAYEHMNNPQTVKIESEFLTVDRVEQRVYFPANEEKIALLVALLKQIDPVRTLVFVNTKHMAESLEGWLAGNGYKSGVLSGDVPQTKRERLLQEFKQGDLPLLIATDVAARGLHIPDVSHVINFDLPQDPEDYVHRVGRTARAGASGDAISFACETHAFSLAEIEEYIGQSIPTARIEAEFLEELQPSRRTRFDKKRARQSDSASRPPKSGRPRSRPQRTDTTPMPAASPERRQIAPKEAVSPAAKEKAEDKVAVAPAAPSPARRREIPAVG